LALVMLPLSGANGLVMTPFLASSFGAGAWLFRNSGQARWPAYVQLGGALCSIILLGPYFVGYERWETFANPDWFWPLLRLSSSWQWPLDQLVRRRPSGRHLP